MSEDRMEIIPKGALFTISTGEYSDYTITGVFRALQDIDAEELRVEWLKNEPEQAEAYKFDEDRFMTSLLKRNLFEQLECHEWHLSSYSKIDEMWVRKYDA